MSVGILSSEIGSWGLASSLLYYNYILLLFLKLLQGERIK
jgi:hypothetical protein